MSIPVVAFSQLNEFRIEHYDVEEGLPQNTVRCIEQDKYGFMWFGTWNGLCRFDGYEFKIYRKERDNPRSLSMNRCQEAIVDSSGNLWIGTWDGVFHLYNYETDDFTRYMPDELENEPVDDDKYEYAAGDSGYIQHKDHRYDYDFNPPVELKYIDLLTNKSTKIIVDPDDPYSLHDIYINDIYIDKYKNLWLGTFSQGVSKANLNRKRIKHYKKYKNAENTFIDHNIREIYADSNGILWLGTRNHGIIKFDRKNNTYKNLYPSTFPVTGIGSDIRELFLDSKGIFWVGTKYGLDRFDAVTETSYNVLLGNWRENWVFDVTEDHRGSIWIASFGGLYKYNKKTNGILVYNMEKGNLADDRLRFVMEDSRKQLWAGSESGGLTRLVRKSPPGVFEEEFESHFYNSDTSLDKSHFESDRAYSICEDENGTVWIGTADGLRRYYHKADTFEHFGIKNGLPDEMIVGIVPDLKGYLWITHKKGMSRLNIKTNEIRNFTVLDGLQGMEFNEDAYSRNKYTGEIFFGGSNGFNAFFPDSIVEDTITPDIYFTKISVNDENVQIGRLVNSRIILEKNIIQTKEITLTHKERIIAIEFAGLHYANPAKNLYEYMLEGFEKKWVKTSAKRRIAVYSNLKPKTYLFKVRASNADGVWCKEPEVLKIIVLPPWWQTWWFRSIVLFFIIGSAVSFNLIRINRIKKQKKVLEHKVALRTKELKEANTELQLKSKQITKAYNNMQVLSEFGQKVTSVLNLEAINILIYDYVNTLMDTAAFGIGVFNPDKDTIEYIGFMENGERLPHFSKSINKNNSFSAWCFNNQKNIFINDMEEEYKNYIHELPDISTSKFPHSLIHIPLTVEEKRIGLIALNSYKKNAYSRNDFNNLQILASYIAIALDNAKIHETLVEQNNLLWERQQKILEQTEKINETNTLLEERQQHIEEQSEELKIQAEELAEKNKNLEETNNTKDKLFSIIAHDLKNPFNTILGFSELIAMRWDTMEQTKIRTFIEKIHLSTKNIFKLLENLLQWSRSQTGNIRFEPETINIAALAKENIDLNNTIISEKNIEIYIAIPDHIKCFADAQMVRIVIRNLLTNAIKYTENSKITISASNEGSFVKVSITDKGMGMSAEIQKKLFTIDKSRSIPGTKGEQGTGLGLIICKEFIEINGGTIGVNSEEGTGSTFFFTLPSAK